MQWYEVDTILTNLQEKERESWEQTRAICFLIAQTNSTKKLKPTDIMRFSWDETEKNISVTTKDKERLRQKSEAFLKQQNKN